MRYIKPYQPTLFEPIELNLDSGRELALVGMELAVETANKKEKDWSRLCWQLFLVWLRRNVRRGAEFKIEDFRKHLNEYGLINPPPSERAYGFLSKKGVKEGFIGFRRVGNCSNKKAHATPVNIWFKK